MSGKLNKVILLLALCGICFHLTAQQYGYVQYNAGSGAPFDQVSSVVQDDEGFIWIGSHNGLYRFDGINFEIFSLHNKSQFIHQLTKYGDSLIFVNDMGVYQVDNLQARPGIGTVLQGSLSENDTLLFYPNNCLQGKNKEIWISQSNHSIGRKGKGGFKSYAFSESASSQKLEIAEDPNGGIWVLSPLDGLFKYDQSRDIFLKILSVSGGKSLLINKDHLLMGSDALYVYELRENYPRLVRTIPMGEDLVTALHVDQNDEYFAGTQNGKLYHLKDLESMPRTIYGANEAHRVEELDFKQIYEIYVPPDGEGSNNKLWVSSETGLWLLQQQFFKTVEDLPMNNPIGIAIGNQGRAWVPMNYLYEIRPEEDDFVANPVFDNMQVNAVAQDKDGFLWVSSTTPKVELVKYREEEIIRRYDLQERGEAIFVLYPDSKGNLWFCQAPVDKPIVGIAKIDARGEVHYYDDTKGFSSRVLAIAESSRGEIYAVGIGEDGYLYRYDAEQDQFVNLSPKLPFTAILNFEAHDLTIDDRGVVWLATTDGLLRYDSEKITLIQNDILGQEEVRGVTHYSNDNIWIASATRGLIFHRDKTSTTLGEQEGLPSVINAYRCITTDTDGRLWAGTPEGLVYSRISAATLPFSNTPRLRKTTIDQEEFRPGVDQVIRLKKNQEIQLQFSNLSFPAKDVQYQYRLLPIKDRVILLEEQNWQSSKNKNILKLSEMEPGDYYLELRAKQPGGYQWSAPLELEMRVFLPWYMQAWVIYGLIGLLILVTAYYFRFYVKKRFMRLQKVLQYSNEKLASKEAQLVKKIKEFEEQKEELANANSNIETLELFIRDIPKKASWEDIITAMGKAVRKSDDINAFEIAFKEKDEIVHRGYSDKERSGYTFRSKPFNPKNSLTCWAMANKKEVLINDFKKEHPMYIQEKEAYRFESLIFIPFTLSNKQPVVLCAYSIRKNDFDHNDMLMFKILAQFIQFTIADQLSKKDEGS